MLKFNKMVNIVLGGGAVAHKLDLELRWKTSFWSSFLTVEVAK